MRYFSKHLENLLNQRDFDYILYTKMFTRNSFTDGISSQVKVNFIKSAKYPHLLAKGTFGIGQR